MIISSVITWNLPQDDGRRIVRETHTDDQNNQYTLDYMAAPTTDLNANLTIHAAQLNAEQSNG